MSTATTNSGQATRNALAGAVMTLSRSRGADLRAANWTRRPNRNALDALSYSIRITAPDGRTALSAEVMMALPGTMNSSLITCAEARITDLTAWAEALAASGAPPFRDLRLLWEEVAEFLTIVWQTATETLAAAVTGNTAAMLWADPPTVELRLTAERRFDNTPLPVLDEYIDMSPLGRSDRGTLREMAVTITAPPRPGPPGRRSLTRTALVYMTQQSGFLDASTDHF
jgi:hypothetical protein